MQTRPSAARSAAPPASIVLLALLALAPAPARAQTFVQVTSAANPIVTDPVPATAQYAGASWVDADADGDPDLYLPQQGLFRNDGAGVFVKVAGSPAGHANSIGNSWADYDNDGDLDLFLTGGMPDGSRLYRNDGGTFTPIVSGVIGNGPALGAWGAAWADVDRDGWVDLVLAVATGYLGLSGPNHLLRNNHDGTFSEVTGTPVTTGSAPFTIPSWADWDNDGDPDLSIGAGHADGTLNPDFLYRNDGGASPSFTRITSGVIATDARDGQIFNWVDIDNDRDLDAYVTNYGGPASGVANQMYRNDGAVFTRLTSAQAGTIVSDVNHSLASVWGDYDNDGDLDCVVTNDGPEQTRYYLNNGAGLFTRVSVSPVASFGPRYGGATADYDGDGDLDLYLHGDNGTHALFQNTSAATNGWLEVRCEGVMSNRAAIGARVSVKATIGGNARWQVQEVSSQNSFNGHNTLVLHFGLGNATVVDSVVVRFPGGLELVRTNVSPRQRISMLEDASTPARATVMTAEATAGSVRLVWWSLEASLRTARVERRTESGDWTSVGAARNEGADRWSFDDLDVRPGEHLGYRLALAGSAGDEYAGEAWVRIPGAPKLELSIAGRGGDGRLRIAFALARAGDARVELLDVAGRRVDARTWSGLAAGRHQVELGARGLVDGVYWVRLTQGADTRVARAVVLAD